MAIDPRLYAKYSGRKGDPRDRLGAALAQSSRQRDRLAEEKSNTYTQRSIETRFKVRIWLLGAGIAFAAVFGLLRALGVR